MNAIFRGEAGIPYTASGAVSAGDIIAVGSLVGVALKNMVSGDTAMLCSNGQFDVAKSSTDNVTFAAGAIVYWDTVNKLAVASSGEGIIKLGYAVSAAIATDAVVRVSLEQLNAVALAGVNSDITSFSGITTPLSVAQGGTGATTAADARTNLGAAAA